MASLCGLINSPFLVGSLVNMPHNVLLKALATENISGGMYIYMASTAKLLSY